LRATAHDGDAHEWDPLAPKAGPRLAVKWQGFAQEDDGETRVLHTPAKTSPSDAYQRRPFSRVDVDGYTGPGPIAKRKLRLDYVSPTLPVCVWGDAAPESAQATHFPPPPFLLHSVRGDHDKTYNHKTGDSSNVYVVQ